LSSNFQFDEYARSQRKTGREKDSLPFCSNMVKTTCVQRSVPVSPKFLLFLWDVGKKRLEKVKWDGGRKRVAGSEKQGWAEVIWGGIVKKHDKEIGYGPRVEEQRKKSGWNCGSLKAALQAFAKFQKEFWQLGNFCTCRKKHLEKFSGKSRKFSSNLEKFVHINLTRRLPHLDLFPIKAESR
jgi:hypothetical protein